MGMREEFEAWVVQEAVNRSYSYMCSVLKQDGECYATSWVDSMWMGWQASRAALVVTLPADDPLGSGPGDCEGGLPSFEQHCAAECNFVLQDCRNAIRAAGVTINTTTVSEGE